MDDKIREYEMLRTEILQYLHEYQSVRNMMYLVTATILGFSLNSENSVIYLYLLPLIVILPSYIISIDYWKCVTKAANYLIVFHEEKIGCPFQWERRHRRFNEKCDIMSQSDYQGVPYMVCALACVILYFVHIKYMENTFGENLADTGLGIAALAVCILIHVHYRKVYFVEFKKEWEKVRHEEEIAVNFDRRGRRGSH